MPEQWLSFYFFCIWVKASHVWGFQLVIIYLNYWLIIWKMVIIISKCLVLSHWISCLEVGEANFISEQTMDYSTIHHTDVPLWFLFWPLFLECITSPSFSQVWHIWDAQQPDARCHGSARQHTEPPVWFRSRDSRGCRGRLPHGDAQGQWSLCCYTVFFTVSGTHICTFIWSTLIWMGVCLLKLFFPCLPGEIDPWPVFSQTSLQRLLSWSQWDYQRTG